MCIICASPAGVRQPTEETIRTMFKRNPHGAGYMFARNKKVEIHKGFMDADEFLAAIQSENFTDEDSVVYHFRISTQAGVTPEMTHPFPLSNQRAHMKALDILCDCGIAHNGVIWLTTDKDNEEYNDTALFITDYLTKIVHSSRDLRNQDTLDYIYRLAGSKLAFLDKTGHIATVGRFINRQGLLFSNSSFSDAVGF